MFVQMDILYEKLLKYYNRECVVLVRLLLFRLTRNRDSETMIPIFIIVVTLWLSGVVIDWTFTSQPRYWSGRLVVNPDAEIKAPWDRKYHFWVSNSSESRCF